MQLFGRQSETRKKRFSVHLVRQKRKCCGGIEEENWNRQYLGPRKGGLESLIREKWQKMSIRRQGKRVRTHGTIPDLSQKV